MKSSSTIKHQTKVTTHSCVLAAVLLVLAPAAQATSSTYTMDPSTAVLSSSYHDGGSITVDYFLSAGPVIEELGTSFPVTYTYTDLFPGPTPPGHANYQWIGNDIEPTTGIGMEAMLASFFYNDNTNLPANNRDSGYTIWDATTSIDSWFRDQISNGYIDPLGTFSVSASAIEAPAGYEIASDQVVWTSQLNTVSVSDNPNVVRQGVWAAPVGSEPFYRAPGDPAYSYSGSITTTHGVTQVFDYTAFDQPDHSAEINQNGRPLWMAEGTITFVTIPEPSGALLLGLGGGLALLRRRR